MTSMMTAERLGRASLVRRAVHGNKPGIPFSEAQKILGRDNAFGYEAIKDGGILTRLTVMPDVVTSRERLNRGAKLGGQLFFLPGSISTRLMNAICGPATYEGGPLAHILPYLEREAFYTGTQASHQDMYLLVEPGILPESLGLPTLGKFMSLANHVQRSWLEVDLKEIGVILSEFNEKRPMISVMIAEKRDEEAVRCLSTLRLARRFCPSARQAIWTQALMLALGFESPLLNRFIQTSTTSSVRDELIIVGPISSKSGGLVNVGPDGLLDEREDHGIQCVQWLPAISQD